VLFLNVRVGSGVCWLGCWVGVRGALYRGQFLEDVMVSDWVGMRRGGGYGTTCIEPV